MSHSAVKGKLIAVIGDEDTCTGFLLGGIGELNKKREPNFLVVDKNTSRHDIEETFRAFLKRDDIAIILINQTIAEEIRYVIDSHDQPVPAVLEIPSKDSPYDSSKDSILRRAKHSTLASMKNGSVLYDRQDSGYPGSPVILETQHIRRNYKYLKREMDTYTIVDFLVQHNILNTEENSFLIGKPRARKCDFILRKLLRHPRHLPEFTKMIKLNSQEQGFRCFLLLPHSESLASEDSIANERVLHTKSLNRTLEKYRDELLEAIKSRISNESDSIVDDFLEEDVIHVDEHEEISTEKNKSTAASLLLNYITNKLPGSYQKLLSILETYELNDLAVHLLKEIDNTDLERTGNEEQLRVEFVVGEVYQCSMEALNTKIRKIRKIKIIISDDDGNEEVLGEVMKQIPSSEEMVAQGIHSTFEGTSTGSVIIVLQTESSYAMAKLEHFIEKEGISKFLAQLFESRDVRIVLTKEKYNIEVQIRVAQEPADSTLDILHAEHRKLETTYKSRLEKCHGFLLEELEPRCLLKEQEVADIFSSVLEKMNQPGLRAANVEFFLEYLKNQSEEKIQVVVDKLKDKNTYIYDQMFPNTAKYEDIDIDQVKGNILDSLPELLDIVSIRAIQTPLLSTGIILSEELDFIHKNSESLRNETLQFMKLVLHRGTEAIKIFLSALETSYGESTVQSLLQPREITSAIEKRHAKIEYKAFNKEDGLLFKGRFVLELKTEDESEKQDVKCIYAREEGPTKDGNLETLSEDHSSSESDSSNAAHKTRSDSESKITSTKASNIGKLELDSSEILSKLTRKLGNVEDVLVVKRILSSTKLKDERKRDEVQRIFPKKYEKIKEDVSKLQHVLKELQSMIILKAGSVFTEKYEYFWTGQFEEFEERCQDETKQTLYSGSMSRFERQDTIATLTEEYGDTTLTESDEDKESSNVLNQQSSKYQGILMGKVRKIEIVQSVMEVFRIMTEKETQLMAIKNILNEEQYKKLEKYIIKLQAISEKMEKAAESADVA
ncbi:uncharacterized protein LOC133181727 [Saccostrea echinata]|uniref:uncharacterized protein LOC133181727 n=1 Tax=Saccostrea echinata TaxID=191078 RepID=UPI002A827A44|nr:uncharacterized protein LOC133181727 [Saccostrea echinata]